jgi:hypothetical protein
VSLFLAKLTLTPLIMCVTSAAGRRWGPGVSGWLTGLPLLAGPVSVFVCIEQGPDFARQAAGSTLLGMWSSCAFCLAYHAFADRGWVAAAVAAVVAFAAATALLNPVLLPPWAGLVGVACLAWACLRVIPAPDSPVAMNRPPRWDMPVRLAIAAGFVVVQTGIARWLGPQLSGLVTPFPIVVILLTAFAHHQLGQPAATRVLRGFLIGMYAFATFFWLVAVGMHPLGPALAYPVALAACLAINGLALWGLRRRL